MNLQIMIASLCIIGAGFVAGCATVYSPEVEKSAQKEELCPDCQAYVSDFVPTEEIEHEASVTLGHKCPTCQDSIVSFFKSGKWVHKCEKCETSSYYCDMSELFKNNEHLINDEM